MLEKFSGSQAMVLSNTSWSSQGHTESMTGLLWTFGRGRREERRTLSWQRRTKSTWSLEAGNDFWDHPKESAHKVGSQLLVTPPDAGCVKTI